MNIISTELFSDIHRLCYIKLFNSNLQIMLYSHVGCFLINELFDTSFNIAIIVESIQGSIYNLYSSMVCSVTSIVL